MNIVRSEKKADWSDIEVEPGLVSVVIPTFNRSNLILDALKSVWAQSYKKIEVIVVDDGSTDGTQSVLQALPPNADGIALSVLRQENAGAAAARNAGIKHSSGEFLYFLDSDDLIYPKAFEVMVEALQSCEQTYCLANIESVNMDEVPPTYRANGYSRQQKGKLLAMDWMTHGALYRRLAIARSGLFNENLKIGEDTEFHWRVAASNGPGLRVNKLIGVRRTHSFGSLTVSRSELENAQIGLNVSQTFFAWAEKNIHVEKKYIYEMLIWYLLLGIKFSALGNVPHAQRAFAFFDHPPVLKAFPWVRFLSAFGRIRYVILFKIMDAAISVLQFGSKVKKRFLFVISRQIQGS